MVSCVGCHEPRTQAPPPAAGMQLQAVARPASRIEPIPGVPEIIEYVRDIQPIWDKNCVSCHNQQKYAAELVLTGDIFNGRPQSYDCLYDRELVTEGGRFKRNNGNAPPRSIGTSASKLWKKIAAGHGKLGPIERNRVWAWIEAAGPMAGTYGAINARVGHRARLDERIMKESCGRCHKKDNKVPPISSYHFDLQNPENSIVLRAPLAKEAGGLELCRDVPEKVIKSRRSSDVHIDSHPRVAIFESKDDPAYRKLLAELAEAAKRRVVYEAAPWVAEGFNPDGGYIKAMQRYGHLDSAWKRGDPIDVYQLDEKYFQSLYPQTHPAGAISPLELEPQPDGGTH
jgi:cytochrome c553